MRVVRFFIGAATLAVVVVLALVVVVAGGTDLGPRAIAPRPAGSPVGVIQRYLAALAGHDASRVCSTFSPQLRTYIGQWDTGPNCRSRVSNSHWSNGNSGATTTGMRIVRVRRVALDRYGNLAVHLVVWFDYSCIGEVGPIPGCQPGFQNRSNVIYLRRIDHRWLIVKPGQVYDDTDTTAPAQGYDPATPPGDRSMVRRLARLPGPIPPCPLSSVAVDGTSRSLLSNDGRRQIAFSVGPWLHIRRVDMARAGHQFCVALSLGARPRVDSIYSLDIGQASGGGELVDSFSLAIDATGTVQAQLTEPSTTHSTPPVRCPTRYGINGSTLEMLITAKSITPSRSVTADVSSASLQPGEPLLRHRLSAGDTAPKYPGLRLAPSAPPVNACASP